MSDARTLPEIHVRPEFEVDDVAQAVTADIALPLSLLERVWNQNWVRKAVILVALIALWQGYTVVFDVEPLMFPRFSDSALALWQSIVRNHLEHDRGK